MAASSKNAKFQSPTLIERREYKYLVPVSLVPKLREAVRPYCVIDPFAGPDGLYTIDSLYYDTDGLDLYFATVEERLDRFKLRVRTYPDTPGAPVFAEVKRRANDVIAKTRGKLDHATWSTFMKDPLHPDLRRPAVERFVALSLTHLATPKVLVRYRREAWMSVLDAYARVTFDQHIRARATETPTFDVLESEFMAADDPIAAKSAGSFVVLELKFTSNAPTWMTAIVQRFNLNRRAFSKYGNGVRALMMPPDIRVPRRMFGRFGRVS